MPDNSDNNPEIPERGQRSNIDPVRQSESDESQTPTNSDSGSRSQSGPQQSNQDQGLAENQAAPRHGETVDLSNDDADEDEGHYSNVPIRPEVQQEIDRYYEKKRQQEQEQEEAQEQQELGNIDESPEPIQGGTDYEPEPESYPNSGPEAAPTDAPSGQPEPDPREFAQEGHEESETSAQPAQQQTSTTDHQGPPPAQEAAQAPQQNTAQNADETADDPAESPQSRESMVDSEEVDLEDIDLDSIENQDWGLGEKRPPKLRQFRGMKFLLTEPEDDDKVVNAINQIRQDDMMTAYYQLVRITVKAPEITEERWNEQMTATEKVGLGNQVLAYLQAQDF